MKFAVQKWVREKEMRITKIVTKPLTHPKYLHHHCDGCHAPLAGAIWVGVWAESSKGKGGGYKLCASCAEEAKAEVSAVDAQQPRIDINAAILQTVQPAEMARSDWDLYA